MNVDRNSSLPLYRQIAASLRQRIDTGVLPPGSRFPNEEALRQHYGTSRITIRNAIQLLADDGLVEKHHGKGTYVRNDVVAMEMGALQGFYGALRRTGAAVTTELLTCDTASPPAELARALAIPAGTPVRRLERLYRVNQRPLALTTSYLWANLAVTFDQAASTTVYGLLAAHLPLNLKEARWSIFAEAASPRHREVLSVPGGSPLLGMSRTTLSEDDVPREHTVHHIVATLYQLHLTVPRDARPLDDDFLIPQ